MLCIDRHLLVTCLLSNFPASIIFCLPSLSRLSWKGDYFVIVIKLGQIFVYSDCLRLADYNGTSWVRVTMIQFSNADYNWILTFLALWTYSPCWLVKIVTEKLRNIMIVIHNHAKIDCNNDSFFNCFIPKYRFFS